MPNKYIILAFILIIITRFAGISWGLPYPMHPDERNMANSVMQLKCEKFAITSAKTCFNPNFYAYGQVPLYLGYLNAKIMMSTDNFFTKLLKPDATNILKEIDFDTATLSLRLISAFFSIGTIFVLYKLIQLFFSHKWLRQDALFLPVINKKVNIKSFLIALFFILTPYGIQYSHFGTTESILMFLYTAIIYLSYKILLSRDIKNSFLFYLSLLIGLAIGTKVSSLLFIGFPLLVIIYKAYTTKKSLFNFIFQVIRSSYILLVLSFFFSLLFSPHNIINFTDFQYSIKIESLIGTGDIKVFYTRQFDNTIPIFFQLTKILPFVLGGVHFMLFLLGFLFLSWKDVRINMLRIAYLLFFLPSAFFYAKWTRFISPIFPLSSIFALLFFISLYQKLLCVKIKHKHMHISLQPLSVFFIAALLYILAILPGLSYVSIYISPDIRFTASKWIYENTNTNDYILAEGGNVVDIPISSPVSKPSDTMATIATYDFYAMDDDINVEKQISSALDRANYILIPSRRIFADHTCSNLLGWGGYYQNHCRYLELKYPKLHAYYKESLPQYTLESEFTSFPRITLFGKTLYFINDEAAEETWTVFDHPVIRIYKKNYL